MQYKYKERHPRQEIHRQILYLQKILKKAKAWRKNSWLQLRSFGKRKKSLNKWILRYVIKPKQQENIQKQLSMNSRDTGKMNILLRLKNLWICQIHIFKNMVTRD